MTPAKELRGARLKLQRAQEHLGNLQSEHKIFLERNPYRMLAEEDVEPGYNIWRAKIVEEPPVERWSSIAGECIHSLRSALDHTAYALVRIKKPFEEKSEFPIFLAKPGDTTYPGKLPAVGKRVLAQVNWLQPYRRGNVLDRLWIIHSLDIIDKHRRLSLVSPSLLAMDSTVVSDKGRIIHHEPVLGPFEDGAVVARYKVEPNTPDVEVKSKFSFDIAFGETEPPIAGEPVMGTLFQLMVYAGFVVARFDRFFV